MLTFTLTRGVRRRSLLTILVAVLVIGMAPYTASAAGWDEVATDSFDRSVDGSWGTADEGGPWSTTGSFSVAGGVGRDALRPGDGGLATLDQLVARDVILESTVTLDDLPTRGGMYVSPMVRRTPSGDNYRMRVAVSPDGDLRLRLETRAGSGRTVLAESEVPVATIRAGERLRVKLQVWGSEPTQVRGKAWLATADQPDWQVRAEDATASLQNPGGTGLDTYLSSKSTRPSTLLVDDITIAAKNAEMVPSADASSPTTSTPEVPDEPAVSVRPTAASTGVPVGAALTRHNGDLVVTTPGTRIDGMDIRGFLRIKAADVSVTNTIVRGRPVDGKRGLLTSTAPGVTIRNVTLAPTTPSAYLDGLRGWGFTADRVEIRDVVDSAHLYGDDVTIRNSWLHHNRHYTNDPNQGGRPSHDDGVQILGGSRITLTGNSITGAYNAAVQITQDYDHARAIRITGNWLGYGGCTVNVAQKDRGPITGLTITNNQFDRDSRVTNCAITHDSTTNPTISGNTWTGTAQPVDVRQRQR